MLSMGTGGAVDWFGTLAVGTLLLAACTSDADEFAEPAADPVAFVQPPHFPAPEHDFDAEPLTGAGFELGKKLFFDARLSSTMDVSCATCHAQTVAFSDPQHRISVGVNNRVGNRNAPSLANLAFTRDFMWDGGINHLDFVSSNALTTFHEMDLPLDSVVRRLESSPEYAPLFAAAYPDEGGGSAALVSSARTLKAISQYLLRLVSANAKYDRHELDLPGGGFSPAEQRGLDAFRQNCASCHAGALFTNQEFLNNGLDSVFSDPGRAAITELAEDEGRFRVPTLRNLSRTAPYMHDGRFRNLDDVLDHYRFGVRASPSLDARVETIVLSDDAWSTSKLSRLPSRTRSSYAMQSSGRIRKRARTMMSTEKGLRTRCGGLWFEGF